MKTNRLAALTLLIASVPAGCAAPKPRAEIPPDPAGVTEYVQAVKLHDNGEAEQAIAALEAAILQNATLRMARITLGEMLMEKKDFGAAVPHLQAAADLDPYTIANHYKLGLSLQLLNRLQESAVAYIRGLKVDPDDFKCNMNLGLVYFAMNKLDSAMYHLDRATVVDPNSSRAWSNLGVVHEARGNAVFAEAAYRRAMELDGGTESTLLNLAGNLIGQRKSAEAVQAATKLVAMNATPMHFKRLGDAYAVGSLWPEAAAAYDQAIRADDRYIPAINAKAELLVARFHATGQLDETLVSNAKNLWSQSLALNPEQPAVTQQLQNLSK